MSPVEAYLADLRSALGDRLPPSVHAARLREARAHLLASAEDVGEAEAVRRYGPPRQIAGDLIRSHRGYTDRSAWRLVLPLIVLTVSIRVASSLVVTLNPRIDVDGLILLSRLGVVLNAIAFVGRVVQTRRWLAGPMCGVSAASAALVVLASLVRRTSPPPTGLLASLCFSLLSFFLVCFAVNALALCLGRVFERRTFGPAGGER